MLWRTETPGSCSRGGLEPEEALTSCRPLRGDPDRSNRYDRVRDGFHTGRIIARGTASTGIRCLLSQARDRRLERRQNAGYGVPAAAAGTVVRCVHQANPTRRSDRLTLSTIPVPWGTQMRHYVVVSDVRMAEDYASIERAGEAVQAGEKRRFSLSEVIDMWSTFITGSRRALQVTIDDYTNDLSIRRWPVQAQQHLTTQAERWMDARLRPLDEAFCAAPVQSRSVRQVLERTGGRRRTCRTCCERTQRGCRTHEAAMSDLRG